ncbi:NAD(P)-dependent oxidoreductase [Micromonospora sp. CPCC 205371]|nr:NAD(P)-dependent oxidoreductase [Micromonospora sp. CPCC 205371]
MMEATGTVAVFGLGGMGAAMASRLLRAGYAVSVYNRTAAKAEPLVAAGARGATSPADAATGARTLLLSLSDEPAVREVLFERLDGRLGDGVTVVDTSTVSPAFARECAERVAATGARRVEACVLGNAALARAGRLRVLAAGEPDDVAAVGPLLDALGQQVLHVGPAGMAATMKLAFNLLLGAQVATLAEAVRYGVAAGLDRDQLLEAIAESGFSSLPMAFRADLMRRRAYDPPAFRTRLMHKDLRFAVDDAARLGVGLPVTATAAETFAATMRAGAADLDAASVLDHSPAQP